MDGSHAAPDGLQPQHLEHWATLIVGKKGSREIGKCFPRTFSSLHLVSYTKYLTLNVGK